jgi:sugar/nucleoside kinase (ribokinase family)
MDNFDVLVIGRSCLDYIAVVEKYPDENQKVPLEFRLAEGGGQGGTASCCISKLGGKVAYVGKLGDDEHGRFCLQRLTDFGVGTRFVEIVKGGTTPIAYLFVTAASGARTIIYERNALPRIRVNATMEKLLGRSTLVLLDPEVTYLGQEIKRLSHGNATIVYDCERWREGIEDMMQAADYFIPASEFLDAEALNLGHAALPDKIFRLKKMVHGRLVVTNGEDGAYYLVDDKLYHVVPPQVNAIDTIGAGDNFHAAFALALKKGFDIHRCVKFSVAVASLSCREFGGRNGIPAWPEAIAVADRLKVRNVESQ